MDSNNTAGPMTLRLFPVPSSDYNGVVVNLRVARLPLARLTLMEKKAIPEIPEDYHLQMLDWAAYLALRIVDHDAGDPERAKEFHDSFAAVTSQVRAEVMRKLFAPLQWGFGRGGFSYIGN